jgi:hypothetical protein
MRQNGRLAFVLLLAYAFTLSLCSVGTAGNEPNAADLVRAVRESENWLHRIDSLQLRVEGKWTRSPESIAARYAELKKQYPDHEPDPNRFWDLKPSESDILEYAIDFKGKRLRSIKDTLGRSYFLSIWDGKQAIGYVKGVGGLQRYSLESGKEWFETLFGSLSWPRAQPHSFWWEPQNVEEKIDLFGRVEDFKIIGRDKYRGVDCHVLECSSRSDHPVTYRWYVGVEDHLLYGRQDWLNPEFVFEYWTLDYKQATPGCWIPMTQGYNVPEYNAVRKNYYISCRRDVKILDVRINDKLPDELFEMKFEEGLTVIDRRSGKTVVYNYIAMPPSLIGKPLPDFKNIKIDFNLEQVKSVMLLMCFWDMNQRPSRHYLMQLSKRAQELKTKDVSVVAVQASKIDKNNLDEWVKNNDIPFPVGMIQDNEDKARLNWGIKSLPWLILTDSNHVVAAEGFGIDELYDKIEGAGNEKR